MVLTHNIIRCAVIAVLVPLTASAQEAQTKNEQIAEEAGEITVISCPDLIEKAKRGTLATAEWMLLNACFSNTPLAPPGIGEGTVAIIPELPGRGDPYGLSTFGVDAGMNGMVDG